MTAQLDDNDSNPALGNLIAEQIAEADQHRICFADYMALALYHPLHGYYATNASKIGAQGDFFTSPHLGTDFGELLAVQFVQMWERLQRPERFTLVEMGAGQGLLATDVLRYLHRHYPQCYRTLDYVIVERAAAMLTAQQQQVRSLLEYDQTMDIPIRWCSLEDIPPATVTGCFFSNELVDALPVHQIVKQSGQLQEVYVTTQTDSSGTLRFVEVVDDLSTPQLESYFQMLGIDLRSPAYPDPYRTEVNLAALEWIATVAERLEKGYVLTVDYGYASDRYYSPRRFQGTLQCYYRHSHHSDPYLHLGQQDITAHVNFTALERQGDQHGLQTLGFTPQGLFLMALGLGDRIAALRQTETNSPSDLQDRLRRREALHLLANPMGLGNFGVLLQAKGLTHAECDQPLRGLSIPG